MSFLSKKHVTAWEPDRLPRHIAIIMDGNGRWAEKRALPRTAGHAAGAETFRRIATYCKDIGIEFLTVYAFSTENRLRPPEEVSAIMELLEKYLHESIAKMERDKVKMKFLGDLSDLNPGLQDLIKQTEEISKKFDGVQVNICLNYGGRDEILQAAELCSGSAQQFELHLYTAGIPDPDLIIRPGGEMRLSNFLLWQAAYAELYFTETLWPDFNSRQLDRAIAEYQKRQRRYRGIEK